MKRNTKHQLTLLSITQEPYPEWDAILNDAADISRYQDNQGYDVITVKHRIHEKIDHMAYKLLSRMGEENFSYQGKTLYTVIVLYPQVIPEAVASRIRLQCIVNSNADTAITWDCIINTRSGIVTTIPDLDDYVEFPDCKEDQKTLLAQVLLKKRKDDW